MVMVTKRDERPDFGEGDAAPAPATAPAPAPTVGHAPTTDDTQGAHCEGVGATAEWPRAAHAASLATPEAYPPSANTPAPDDVVLSLLGAHGYREQKHENVRVIGEPARVAEADEALRDAVLARIAGITGFDHRSVEVRVRGRHVTLRGIVDAALRDDIAAAVAEVVGVGGVENDLRIARDLDIFPRRSSEPL